MADYRVIPLQTYPRRAHFQYFSQLAQPYGGLTVAVEITSFWPDARRWGVPFSSPSSTVSPARPTGCLS